MGEFLQSAFGNASSVPAEQVAVRLLIALALGGVVAWIYRSSRPPHEIAPTFSATLVLLSILIAMVTQVIGDSVARAFSLVGALSIVRFRTVVRDTQDTAYVIFAVVVGMAAGASDFWVAAIGITIVALAAYLLRTPSVAMVTSTSLPYVLHVRLTLAQSAETLLSPVLDSYVTARDLLSITTARQGLAFDVSYAVQPRRDDSGEALVKALNALEGVLSVELQRRDAATNDAA